MNYQYYKQLQRKQLKKTIIFTIFIMVFTCICTYYIYNKFESSRNEISSSKSLEVIFHEKDGNKVNITKVTPVTDSVGLSSRAYTFTIKNNTPTKVKYKIRIVKNKELTTSDNCGEYQIPLNLIETGIHRKGEVSTIYNLDDLEDGVITERYIAPQNETDYTLRFWVTKNSLTLGANLHFHGIIEVIEE